MLLLGKIPHLSAVYIRGVMCLYIMQIKKRINLEGKCTMYVVWHIFRKGRIYSMVTFGIIGITLLAGVSLAHIIFKTLTKTFCYKIGIVTFYIHLQRRNG